MAFEDNLVSWVNIYTSKVCPVRVTNVSIICIYKQYECCQHLYTQQPNHIHVIQ